MRRTTNNIFTSQKLKDIKYLTRLQLGLCHLYKHKFKNNFQDTLNLVCTFGCDAENTCHFLLHWLFLSLKERNNLLNKITSTDSNILNQPGTTVTKTLPFGKFEVLQ